MLPAFATAQTAEGQAAANMAELLKARNSRREYGFFIYQYTEINQKPAVTHGGPIHSRFRDFIWFSRDGIGFSR
jgi:hypothetical protein